MRLSQEHTLACFHVHVNKRGDATVAADLDTPHHPHRPCVSTAHHTSAGEDTTDRCSTRPPGPWRHEGLRPPILSVPEPRSTWAQAQNSCRVSRQQQGGFQASGKANICLLSF